MSSNRRVIRLSQALSIGAAVAATLALARPAAAVSASFWTQTSEADFNAGAMENVVATNHGDLKLSRAVKTLLEEDPEVTAVYALAQAPDGTIYAGAGPRATLLAVKNGKVSTVTSIDGATTIFSLLVDRNGALLIGTGGQEGRVLKIDKPSDPASKPVEIFKADGIQYIWRMCQTPDGNLYIATGPKGKLFELKPGKKPTVLLDTTESNLTALTSDGGDLLYVGSDPNGLVYRVNRKTGDSFVMFDAPEAEISSLVLDSKGNLFAATAEARDDQGNQPQPPQPGDTPQGRPEGGKSGVPIPAQPPTEPKPPTLPQPNPGEPNPIPRRSTNSASKPMMQRHAATGRFGQRLALAQATPPNFFAAASGLGEGRLLSLAASQPPITEADADDGPGSFDPGDNGPGGSNAPGPLPQMPGGPNGPGHPPQVVPGGPDVHPEGNAVYKIDKDGFVEEIFRGPVVISDMIENNGDLILATGISGQIFQVNPKAEETVVLAKVDPKEVTSLLAAKDGTIYLGTANVGGIATLSSGYAPHGMYTSAVLDATQISRFGTIQLHGSLPKGTTLTVQSRSGNVRDASEKGWSKWTDPVSATQFMSVAAPSARFLQYRVNFSSDKADQTPVVEDVSTAYQMPNLAPQIKSIKIATTPDQNAAPPSPDFVPPRIPSARRQTVAWEAADPNGDPMQYALYFRLGSTGPWILLANRLTQPQYEWDTRTVADGRYEVKVIASDELANPVGNGKTANRVSDPITVDNTPPVIGDLTAKTKGGAIEVRFRVADHTSIVAAADYTIDSNKDWQAVLPTDNIFDGPDKTVDFKIAGLSPGKHQIAVRATDSSGNQAFENVYVTVENTPSR